MSALKTFLEVALALNQNQPAVQKRVDRAVEKLRTFFIKRGLKISTGVLLAAISANSLQAAPAGLASSVTTAAVLKGAAAGA